ncbi:MAG: hypothetical protein BWZ10_00728 [candidate division BRC1 bacterium ADurb.BinA364]|nr:MAG: hypothetical protein BWZ10_00728 [candidate division BRC1 bacterium ADurb.BinA364]
MAGHGGVDGDVGRFFVAHFADHDHVGILAQNRAQAGGEGELPRRVDLHLLQPFDLVFDRVFDGDDAALAGVDGVQRDIERGGFARAGRAGHQHQPVGAANGPFEVIEVGALQAQLHRIDMNLRSIEQAHGDVVAMRGWRGVDADIDILVVHPDAHFAILRDSALGDVEIGLDFYGAEHRQRHVLIEDEKVAQHAVDSVAHFKLLHLALHVQVGGPFSHGQGQQSAHQIGHGVFFQRSVAAAGRASRRHHFFDGFGEVLDIPSQIENWLDALAAMRASEEVQVFIRIDVVDRIGAMRATLAFFSRLNLDSADQERQESEKAAPLDARQPHRRTEVASQRQAFGDPKP